MKAGVLIIKTIIDNSGIDKGLAEVKAKGKLAGTNFSNLLGKGLKRALNLGKGLGKAFTVALKSIVKISAAIGGIGLLLGGLLVGVGILGLGFKKAFENEQIKANLDYIKFAITKALEPAVNRIADIIVKIVNLLFRIMQYINYIIYRWTGKNIFENASVDAYADSIKQADKNAKSLKKTLQTTGFDEMEILQDNSSATSSATGGAMPDFDLSKIEDVKIPSWIQWIADNKDGILAFLAGLVTYLALTKLGLSDIKALGFGLVIWGIVDAIKELKEYIEDPTWENFGGVIEGISLALIGLGLIIGNLPLVVIAAIVLAFAELIKHWDEIKKWIQEKVFGWFDNKIDEYRKKGFWGNLFAGILTEIKRFIYDIVISFDTLFGGLREQLDGWIRIFKGDFANGIPMVFKGTANAIIGIINTFSSLINGLFAPLRGLINEGAHLAGIKTNIGDYMRLPMLPRLAKGTIANAPGHGVLTPGRNALYGEAGREAYLPLSDEQLLEELGSSIGRHITLNLTNINKMNGRVLNRTTTKIKSEDEFAYNG